MAAILGIGVVLGAPLVLVELPVELSTRDAIRAPITSHDSIERAAFDLFAQHGFEGTTMDAIAREVGVSKRTLFRYYPSKNDIPWGQFSWNLANLRRTLAEKPLDIPVYKAVHRGVLEFNPFPGDARPSHRDRMRLILTTPELQAHSVHQYAAWRAVIDDSVAHLTCMWPTSGHEVSTGDTAIVSWAFSTAGRPRMASIHPHAR